MVGFECLGEGQVDKQIVHLASCWQVCCDWTHVVKVLFLNAFWLLGRPISMEQRSVKRKCGQRLDVLLVGDNEWLCNHLWVTMSGYAMVGYAI